MNRNLRRIPVSLLAALLFIISSIVPACAMPTRIVGGTDAKPGELPFMVALVGAEDDEVFCGGALIDKRWVLTAAHCFFDDSDSPEQDTFAEDVRVILGTIKIGDPDRTEVKVKEIYEPGYDGDVHDIALLELAEPVSVDHNQIDTIPYNAVEEFPGLKASTLTAGWGATNADGTGIPDVLQKITIQTVACDSDVASEYVCASDKKGKDSCQGDSGGPLVTALSAVGPNTPTSSPVKYVQVGIVSFGGDVCGLKGAYTRTSAYASWIKKTIVAHSG